LGSLSREGDAPPGFTAYPVATLVHRMLSGKFSPI